MTENVIKEEIKIGSKVICSKYSRQNILEPNFVSKMETCVGIIGRVLDIKTSYDNSKKIVVSFDRYDAIWYWPDRAVKLLNTKDIEDD